MREIRDSNTGPVPGVNSFSAQLQWSPSHHRLKRPTSASAGAGATDTLFASLTAPGAGRLRDMTKVQAIEKEVESLSSKELVAFRRWFEELDAESWDRQLEDDVHAGRLDALAEEALEAYEADESSGL